MKIGFDLISDLFLGPEDSFNWENKATSLYCLVAGNISHDLRTLVITLSHLSKYYQGVFFIPGALEYQDINDIQTRTDEILRACQKVKNVAVLYQHVVIIDGIAILGANGWYGNIKPSDIITELKIQEKRHEDIAYLKNSIEKLQKHLDVRKVIILTNSVPGPNLYFGEVPDFVVSQVPLNLTLFTDTEHKISHWAFGTHEKIVDTEINSINYVNNPKLKKQPYWAKRIEVEF
jgi:hypothetical protein